MEYAEITGAGKPLRVRTKPIPDAPPSGLLLRTMFAGVCYSEVHLVQDNYDLGDGTFFHYRDLLGDKYVGVIPGHEMSGIVHSLGRDVPADCDVTVGDRVVIYPWRGCRKCPACLVEENNACTDNQGSTTELGQGPNPGGYASFVPVPEWQLAVKVPVTIPMDLACTLPCSALTAFSTLLKAKPHLESALRMRGEANLLVIGVGGLGTWLLVLTKFLFKDDSVRPKVICADVTEEKLKAAMDVGADDVILWNKFASLDDVTSCTVQAGYKLDAAVDFVGTPTSVGAALASIHKRGTVVVVGKAGGTLKVPLSNFIDLGGSLQGNRTGSIINLRKLVNLLANGLPAKLPRLELHSLQEINDILDRLRKGEVKGRAVIAF